MRYSEIASGLRVPISGEQASIMEKLGDKTMSGDDFDEREQEVARLMVSRGLLKSVTREDKTYYRVSSAKDIWRGRYDS